MEGRKLNRSFLRSIIKKDNRDQDKLEDAIGLTTLHTPDEVVVDLIFVHGLRGGSHSTWTKNKDVSLFWPQKWLPKDDAFRDVRIHTFGYAAGVGHESVVNIPHFAGSLLSSIYDSPSIKLGENVPLIFIGHSMGGLVIKKAFIIGQDNLVFKPLVDRIRGIFFLATPHHGAHLAQSLSRIFAVAPRPFVGDISPDSPVLESINEDFPRYCSRLDLFSFFENKPMNFFFRQVFIVERQNAVMNYINERKTYLEANHRDVARFSSPKDSSYRAIRDSLAKYIEKVRSSQKSARQLVGHNQLEALNKFLEISDTSEDLMTLESIRLPGSCEWLPQRDYFQRWQDAACSQVLWLRGRPGAGKSVLCSYVVNYLQDSERDCCFFFFTNRDKPKATINSFLRSMAWQMAMMHPEILLRVLEISVTLQDRTINKVDHIPIWKELYLSGILKVQLNRPQYWVIDSLDECKGCTELVNFLTIAQKSWPLYLLVTSRNPVSKYIISNNPKVEIVSETILEEETSKDISLFLKANIDSLPVLGFSRREAIANQILQTSSGCFLWVNLILNELRQVSTSAEMKKVLGSSSENMDSLYLKILTDMTTAKFSKDLTKTILTWTTCSFRPLSTKELHTAIELDIKDTINDIERSISTCCGNLVHVDSSKKVQLIHLTLRDFLTRQDIASEFIIERASGHKRLALACLQYLSSNEMRAPRPKKLSGPLEGQVKSAFADYSCKFLFQHLVYVKSYDDEVFIELSKFLTSTNALSWIEHLATISELQQVFHAGKTINNLLNRRSQHTPPLGLRKELSLLERWGNDLIHLVTKFGKQLSFSPSSIHHLIAPFCPLDSALKQQFSSSYRGLSVYGLSATVWNDCLSIINYSKPTRPTAVATSAGIFVLGMSTGNIIVYNDITCQESYTLDNGEPVQCLVFGETGKYLASSGDKLVRVWDTTSWSELFKVSIADECIALTFTEEDRLLLGAIKSNQLMYWDIANNGILHDVPTDWMSDLGRELSWLRLRPTMASFNPYQNLLAVIYPGKDILLWDYERECIYDIYEKNSGSRFRTSTPILGGMTSVCSLAFNTTLLAAAYIDGDVVIYDTISGEVSGFLTGINALALSLSLDGRTLASADAEGTIQLFDLDALKVIYRLQSDDEGVGARFLAFTSDSYRVIDVRKYQCLIWEPVVLLRQDLDDENSDTVSVSTAPQEIDYKVLGCICITAIACVQSAPIVFCGKEDGSVHAYDISSEPQNQQLFVQTPGASILLIHFDVEKGILTCSDSSGRVVSRELVRKQPTGWETRDPLVDIRAGTRVTNILASGKHSRLLVSTDGHDTLWQIPKNAGEAHFVRFEIKEKRQWVQHATNPDQLILVTASEAKIYHWTTLEYISLVLLSNLTLHSAVVDRFIALHHTRFFATVTKDLSQIRSSQLVIQIWDKDINLNSGSVSSAYNFGTLSSTVEAVIGVVGDRLIFLNNNYWICSIDLDSVEKTTVRHFFIPNDWVSSVNQLILDIGQNGEIAFVKRAELAVIKRGLEITEKGTFKPPRKGSTIPKPTRLVRLQY